ncbi:hypothetical protein [Chryseobacterium sp. HR92]|uniref:hypothetical protein n=1 Tax=Chryseobacterium sp. HR92 TaxID=3094839 RepID=UPI00388EC22B|nr:hypothetical protein SFA27_16865 [Chryseobacterium sp. HR92]
MTAFVEEQSKHYVPKDSSQREKWLNDFYKMFFNDITNYAKFLKQPLTLGMFVPVDEEGGVLKEEPKYCFASKGSEHYERHEKYWKAKEKVMFEGFEMQPPKHKGLFDLVSKNGTLLLNLNFPINEDVEWLLTLGFGIELTHSALKQIGL